MIQHHNNLAIAGRRLRGGNWWETDANLELYLPFTTDATDRGPNGLDGTLYGNATISSSVLALDGTDDYVGIPSDANVQCNLPVTYVGWIKIQANPIISTLIFAADDWTGSAGLSLNKYFGYVIGVRDSLYEMSCGNGLGPYQQHRKSYVVYTTPPKNTWIHIGAVFNNFSSFDFFINAVEQSGSYSGTATSIAYSGQTGPWLGRRDGSADFEGEMSNVLVFSRALSQTEISEIKTGTDPS